MSPGSRDVEVSIVNHQNRELLRSCLTSLPAACQGLAWHTTVIDNASGDGSLEMLAADFAGVAVIANRARLGFGANHNQVLRPLVRDRSARFALILNDDTEMHAGAVTAMVRAMEADPRLGAIVPTVVNEHGKVAAGRLSYPTVASALRRDLTDLTEPPDPDHGWLQGCCIMVRVVALGRVGGFDERFFLFYEDTDLSRRLVDAGWSLGVCPDATVVHYGHASVLKGEMAQVTPKQGLRSRYLYFAKHNGPRRARAVSLAGRSVLLARAVRAASHGALHHDVARLDRARHLLDLARLDPRRPLAPEIDGFGVCDDGYQPPAVDAHFRSWWDGVRRGHG
ncbi:MAG: glycosyltransferase family 2 protein [Actinomycetota bacterium]|nr:glycosyltransferase family 2 protein [Actinomycetota bacterium]